MDKELIEQFHQKALQVYEDGKRETGYCGKRYLQKVRKDGGMNAAKSWLKRRSRNDTPTSGFIKLVEYGRLDVSLEAQVIKEPWSRLFTTDELSVARNRLARYGYFDNKRSIKQNIGMLPEELDPSEKFYEGVKTSVIINSFERNQKARDACVTHYGPKCFVCGITFGETYGPLAAGYIHVHHLCSLASIGSKYKIDPIADLRPVCPNCHAVIHLRKPPFTIKETREMIKKGKIKNLCQV